MNRLPLIAAAVAIALSSTAVIATAHDKDTRRGEGRENRIDMILERFDTDGDGTITKAEVEALAAERFAAADADGDGLLSAAELVAARDARDAERANTRIGRMIERLDTDDDGLLSAEELAAGEGRRGDIFDRLDADEDGTITQAELEEMAGKMRGMGRGRGHGNR